MACAQDQCMEHLALYFQIELYDVGRVDN
jgi:hypothetical protein